MTLDIGTEDIVAFLQDASYKMDADEEYYSWKDGNEVEHRDFTGAKVHGSFVVICDDNSDLSFEDLLEYIDEATSDNTVSLNLYITNQGIVKTINAFLTLKTSRFMERSDGSMVQLITVKVDEA